MLQLRIDLSNIRYVRELPVRIKTNEIKNMYNVLLPVLGSLDGTAGFAVHFAVHTTLADGCVSTDPALLSPIELSHVQPSKVKPVRVSPVPAAKELDAPALRPVMDAGNVPLPPPKSYDNE